MTRLGDLLRWFSGGTDGYMSLGHCLRGDTFWITLTVILDLVVALGYLIIARHWWLNEKSLPASQAKMALANMKRIFLFCGMCGYLFIPIKMIWPAWRLYDCFMILLVFYTWRYALNVRQLRVVYHELGRTKQLALELAASREESRRKSFFLNAISHDLRTPLNGLMLQTDLAELSLATDDVDSIRESLREIKASARMTADMLGSFLELGRLDWSEDSSRPTRFDLVDLVAQVVANSRGSAEIKGLRVEVVAPASLAVRTDRLKLERILQNLVNNAVKFTHRGRVVVEIEVAGRDVTIGVVDTGVGISAGSLASIFEEFYQVENSERDRSKGFGLGLSIARRLARLLGGDLLVQSELGVGSRFTATLPDLVDDGTAAEVPAGPASASVG